MSSYTNDSIVHCAPTGDVQGHVARLFVYPVKSCAGVEVREALLADTGLDLDRTWMVVDADGRFVTQREQPKMALVRPQIRSTEVVLRAPGMLALHLGISEVAAEVPSRVRVWDDEVDAWDMGPVAAQWFSDFLAAPGLRLVRFDPEARRVSSLKWTGGVEALNQFADGFPLLAVSEGSLNELNARLQAAGEAPVGVERFRPNLVLGGVAAHDEDRLGAIRIVTAEGAVVLKPVKPCARCPIPNIDPATGESSPAVLDALQGFRQNAVMGGAVTFGMNAIALEGVGNTLAVGQALAGDWRFD